MYEARVKRLKDELITHNLDAILISNFFNIVYLTGFKTLTTQEREAFVLVTKRSTYLFTDARYIESKDKLRTPNYELKLLEPGKGLLYHLEEIVKEEKIKTVGFESEDLRYLEFNSLSLRLSMVQFTPTTQLIIGIREIKDDEEIKKIERACEIGDSCLKEIVPLIKIGITEKEIAFKMEMWIKEHGYDLAFDPIIAIDANSAVAHYNTKEGEGKVVNGSIILLDYGVKYKDYLSDMTRMLFLGRPKEDVAHTYNMLLHAQEEAIIRLSKTDSLKEIDEVCRKLLVDNHLPSYPHSTGHGVGLEIHEYPKVSMHSQDTKKENQVITVEPGVYFSGKWGMRIEDTVVIDHKLQPKISTKISKALLIL